MKSILIVAKIALIVFSSEGLIRAVLYAAPHIDDRFADALVDPSLLILITSPLIFFFVIRPYINASNCAESRLRKLAEELENRVTERTRQLTNDIAERRNAEKALRESEETLKLHILDIQDTEARLEAQGAEMVGLADDLAIARDEAERANRAKSAFLASMSHELRTPLNAIIGFSEMMTNKIFGPVSNPHYEEYARDIRNSGEHLLSLINDVLDLSKIEAGKLELNEDTIDISVAIKDSINIMRERAATAKVEIRNEVPNSLPYLRADERMIKQILFNLLSNSIKFTLDGGYVAVQAKIADSGELIMTVSDSGVGIAKEDIKNVLAPFGQLDSILARKHKGTGLGVPLVKELVQMHGGIFEFDSELGKGTTVNIRFPVERVMRYETSTGKSLSGG